MAGWIKIPHGREVAKWLDGSRFHMVGRWPNGWMDQDNTWHGGGPRSRSHCARLGPSSPPKKGHSRPIFSPFPLWPNCSMHQDATWYGGRLRPRPHYARWGPSFPFPKKGTESPQFSVHVYCGKTAVWIMMPLGAEVELSPGHIVLDGDPAPFPRKGHSSPPFFSAHVYSIVATVAHLSYC